jgi:hypothetical protein
MTATTEDEHTPPEAAARRQIGLLALSLFGLAVGILTGFGAAILRSLMALFHNLFFVGKLSFYHDANTFEPVNPWGPWIILEPVIGWTNHHSIAEFNGQWYLFYHDTELSGGQTHLRNIKMTELTHNPDGTIETIDPYRD